MHSHSSHYDFTGNLRFSCQWRNSAQFKSSGFRFLFPDRSCLTYMSRRHGILKAICASAKPFPAASNTMTPPLT